MNHPDITRFADYVRGVGSEAEQNRLRLHLDSGCRRCVAKVAALERMAATARLDARQAPPAAALRSAKAVMALHRPERRSWLAAAAFELRRDSALELALGTRSGDSPGRQLLFETGGWSLDLSVEPAADATGLALAGNCLRHGDDPLVGATVLAVSDGRVAGGADTDELGEFVFEELPPGKCELWLFAEASRPLVAELDLSS